MDPETALQLSAWGTAAVKVYKSRHWIYWTYDFVRNLFRSQEVAVMGLPGSGKTVLVDAMTNGLGLEYSPPGESVQVEKAKRIAGKKKIVFAAVPGQHTPDRLTQERKYDKKPPDGIIFAVSFGFTAVRNDLAAVSIAESFPTLQKFREAQLQKELDELDHTCHLIRQWLSNHNKPTWMIVATTKYDLYLDRAAEAARYYSPYGDGVFAQKMKAFQAKVGHDRFTWSAQPVFAHPERFVWNKEVVDPQADLEQRRVLVGRFFGHVESHCVE